MKVIKDKISLAELKEIDCSMFANLVKAVVDVEKKIMVVGGELHAVDYFYFDNQFSSSDKLWQNYFYAFSYAVRLKK